MDKLSVKPYKIEPNESVSINILKFWLIIGVVFVHSASGEVHFSGNNLTYQLPNAVVELEFAIREVISRAAVPAFFMISAILLYRHSYKWLPNMKKKLRTIAIPYLLISSIWIAIYFIAQHIGPLSSYFSNPNNIVTNWNFTRWLDAYLGFETGFPLVFPLWFMRDLFVMNILSVLLKLIIDKVPRLFILVVGLLLLANVNTHIFFLPIATIFYFSLGYYIVKYDVHLSDVRKINPVLLTIAFFSLVILATLFRETVAFHILQTVSIVISILFFTRLAITLKDGNFKIFMIFMSQYAIAIYLFHECTLTIMTKIVAKIMPQSSLSQLIQFFGNVILIIALCTIVGFYMKKWVPKVYSVLTGNR